MPSLPHKVTTDAGGRFRISGIGRERLVLLRIDAPNIASQELHVLTRAGAAFQAPEVDARPKYNQEGLTITYYPATFKHAAGPTKPIVGVVRDKDTNKPLAGMTLKSYKLANNPIHGLDFLETKTDAQGRYRLLGMPKGKGNKIRVAPGADQPYFSEDAGVPDTAGLDPVIVDFKLKQGIWIEGRITDKATGKSVQGVVTYFPRAGNPNLRDHPRRVSILPGERWILNVREDGTYRVVGLPGPGILAVTSTDEYLVAHERDDEDGSRDLMVSTVPVVVSASHNALARIDPPKDAKPFKRDMILDPGEMVAGTVLGPDGKPLTGARVYGLTAWSWWDALPPGKAEFTVRAYNRNRPRLILFQHLEKCLIGVFEAPKDKAQPAQVRLRPGASVVGRLVDGDGRPQANREMKVTFRRPEDPASAAYYPDRVKTDQEGRFRIEALLPGFDFALSDAKGSVELGDGLRSGETKDLGNVQIRRGDE